MKSIHIKPLYQFSLTQNLQTMLWVYGFSVGVPLLFIAVAMIVSPVNVQGSINGAAEFATLIALFVQMIVDFRNVTRMGIQNGHSRKTAFLTQVSVLVTMAAVYSFINVLVGLIFSSFANEFVVFTYILGEIGARGVLLSKLLQFTFNFCMMLLAGAFGMFLSAMYWRLDKLWRVVVSVGIPATLFIGLPSMVLRSEAGFRISVKISQFLLWCMGYDAGRFNPIPPICSSLILAAIAVAVTWPIFRKAIIRR